MVGQRQLSWTPAQASLRRPLCLPSKYSASADLHCREGVWRCLLAWPPLSLIPCNQSTGPKSGKGDLVSNWNLVSYPLTPLPEEAIDNGQLRPVTQHFWFLPGLFSSPILSLSTLPPSICPAPKSSTCVSHSLQAIPLSKIGDESMGIAHRDESSFQSCREKSGRQDTLRTSPCSLCLQHSHFLPSAGTPTGNISKRYLCLQSCIDSQVPINCGYTSLMGVNSDINITCCFVKMQGPRPPSRSARFNRCGLSAFARVSGRFQCRIPGSKPGKVLAYRTKSKLLRRCLSLLGPP